LLGEKKWKHGALLAWKIIWKDGSGINGKERR
jgi:hypothetical protein